MAVPEGSKWATVPAENKQRSLSLKHNMCISIYLYNPALLTPAYNGQFRLSKQKAQIFSVKLTCLIPAMKTFLCPASHTLVRRQPCFTTQGTCALS